MSIQLKDKVNNIIRELIDIYDLTEDATYNSLSVKIAFKDITTMIDGFDETYKQSILEESAKWNKQDFDGYHVDIIEGGGRYSYDHIPEWVNKKAELKALELGAQASAKAQKINQNVVSNDGELIEPARFIGTAAYVKLGKPKA
jgi:hypothetical protein